MTGEEFRSLYQLGERLTPPPVVTHRAIDEAATPVLIHYLLGSESVGVARLREELEAARDSAREKILRVEDVDGIPVVVTKSLSDFTTFRDWLVSLSEEAPPGGPSTTPVTSTANPGETPGPGGVEEPTVSAEPRDREAETPGAYTRLFKVSELGLDRAEPTSPGRGPAGPTDPGSPAPPGSAAPVEPSAPEPAAPDSTPPSSSQDAGKEEASDKREAPGAYTMLFGKGAESPPPSPEPSGAPEKDRPPPEAPAPSPVSPRSAENVLEPRSAGGEESSSSPSSTAEGDQAPGSYTMLFGGGSTTRKETPSSTPPPMPSPPSSAPPRQEPPPSPPPGRPSGRQDGSPAPQRPEQAAPPPPEQTAPAKPQQVAPPGPQRSTPPGPGKTPPPSAEPPRAAGATFPSAPQAETKPAKEADAQEDAEREGSATGFLGKAEPGPQPDAAPPSAPVFPRPAAGRDPTPGPDSGAEPPSRPPVPEPTRPDAPAPGPPPREGKGKGEKPGAYTQIFGAMGSGQSPGEQAGTRPPAPSPQPPAHAPRPTPPSAPASPGGQGSPEWQRWKDTPGAAGRHIPADDYLQRLAGTSGGESAPSHPPSPPPGEEDRAPITSGPLFGKGDAPAGPGHYTMVREGLNTDPGAAAPRRAGEERSAPGPSEVRPTSMPSRRSRILAVVALVVIVLALVAMAIIFARMS